MKEKKTNTYDGFVCLTDVIIPVLVDVDDALSPNCKVKFYS